MPFITKDMKPGCDADQNTHDGCPLKLLSYSICRQPQRRNPFSRLSLLPFLFEEAFPAVEIVNDNKYYTAGSMALRNASPIKYFQAPGRAFDMALFGTTELKADPRHSLQDTYQTSRLLLYKQEALFASADCSQDAGISLSKCRRHPQILPWPIHNPTITARRLVILPSPTLYESLMHSLRQGPFRVRILPLRLPYGFQRGRDETYSCWLKKEQPELH